MQTVVEQTWGSQMTEVDLFHLLPRFQTTRGKLSVTKMKKTSQKPKPQPRTTPVPPPQEEGFTFALPQGCKTCLSFFFVLLGFLVSAFIAAGPFDGWICMFTARTFCDNVEFVGKTKLPEYSPMLTVFHDQFLAGALKGAQVK
jgi:hypothetical protein